MPPKLPRRKKVDRKDPEAFAKHFQEKLAESGESSSSVVDWAKASASTTPLWGPNSSDTAKMHKLALEKFDSFLRGRDVPVQANGKAVRSLADWKAYELAYPTASLVKDFLEFTVQAEAETGRPMSRDKLRRLDKSFHAGLRRELNILSKREDRKETKDFVEDLCKQLPISKREKALLTVESLRAIQQAVVSPRLGWKPRRRLTAATYSALATQSALRPSSQLRISGWKTEPKRRGATYGMFSMYVVRSGATGPNQVVGYFRPAYDKRRRPPKRFLPLTRAPTVSGSSLFLVLLSLVADGGLSMDALRAILTPSFTQTGTRRLVVPAAWRHKPVFPDSRRNPATTQTLRRALKELSDACGFAEAVTPYSFRHLGAWSARQAGASLSHIRTLLGHQLGSTSVWWYLGLTLQQLEEVETLSIDGVEYSARDNAIPEQDIEPWMVPASEVEEAIKVQETEREYLFRNNATLESPQDLESNELEAGETTDGQERRKKRKRASSSGATLAKADRQDAEKDEWLDVRRVLCGNWHDFDVQDDLRVLEKLVAVPAGRAAKSEQMGSLGDGDPDDNFLQEEGWETDDWSDEEEDSDTESDYYHEA